MNIAQIESNEKENTNIQKYRNPIEDSDKKYSHHFKIKEKRIYDEDGDPTDKIRKETDEEIIQRLEELDKTIMVDRVAKEDSVFKRL